MSSVAEMVSKARAARRLTVRELAPQIKKKNGDTIGPSFVTDIEKGRGIPSAFVAAELARVLGIPSDKLLAACERERRLRNR